MRLTSLWGREKTGRVGMFLPPFKDLSIYISIVSSGSNLKRDIEEGKERNKITNRARILIHVKRDFTLTCARRRQGKNAEENFLIIVSLIGDNRAPVSPLRRTLRLFFSDSSSSTVSNV